VPIIMLAEQFTERRKDRKFFVFSRPGGQRPPLRFKLQPSRSPTLKENTQNLKNAT
jgi:hypothetical protein